ncbi:MAG: hypothetical protein H9535_06995 [Ignavibacteria bacterium]|jgi:hypothetical protein|nr:hypothetical protein [Ignavibacteria bacterium]MBL7992195.1 hypothetical protein [Candidatus Kapabacteria bacterium]
MLTELFIRYFFGSKSNTIYPPSEDRLDFLNVVVWLTIACILVWVMQKIL